MRERPFFAASDDLLLGGHLLLALENARMPMHAMDYAGVSVWVGEVLSDLDTAVVLRLRTEGPIAVRELAENALFERGEPDWAANAAARRD
ncbi:MAG: hypothetical protein ABW220_10475, partial [Burkholderiaceae bacterium]